MNVVLIIGASIRTVIIEIRAQLKKSHTVNG